MGFWRKEPPVFDGTIAVKGGMTEPQREWWELPNYIRLLVGGYGSGKTNVLCKRMSALALENPGCPVAIVSPTFPMARETVIVTMREMLQGKKTLVPGFNFHELKQSPYVFFLSHGNRKGRVLIYSGEDPERLKGPNLAAAGIDEPFIQDRRVFEQMLARTRHPRARRREINLTGTPEDLNWGYDLAEGKLGKRYDVGVVRAPSRSNLALPDQFLRTLEAGYDSKTAQAYLEGYFVSLVEGAVYHAFSKENNVMRLARPDDAVPFTGWDFNVSPLCVSNGWVLNPEDRDRAHVHIESTHEFEDANTESAAAAMRQRSDARLAYPDSNVGRATNAPVGVTDHDYLRSAGYEVVTYPGGNPRRRDRWNTVNGMLQSPHLGVRFTISPDCEDLIRYLSTYAHKKIKQQEYMSHLIDASTYPITSMFGPKAGRDGMAEMVA